MWQQFLYASPVTAKDSDGSRVRTTAEKLPAGDAPTLPNPPDWNERDTDTSGDIAGIARRDVTGNVVDSKLGAPTHTENPGAVGVNANDQRWALNGIYAHKERMGFGGHGTMPIYQSLEPTIHDGATLGGTIAIAAPIDNVISSPMTPIGQNEGQYAAEQQGAIKSAFASQNSSLSGVWR